jgi:hypothetical protein
VALVACGTPEVEPPPPAQPVTDSTSEAVGDFLFSGQPIQVRVLTSDGAADHGMAAVRGELARVETLTDDSAELAQVRSTFVHVAGQLSVEPEGGLPDELRRAYVIDRAADVLAAAGSTDFLVAGGVCSRAAGSMDGTHGRGWVLGLELGGTLSLRDEASCAAAAAGRAEAVAGSAVLAASVALHGAPMTPDVAVERARAADLAVRVAAGGQIRTSPRFGLLLSP